MKNLYLMVIATLVMTISQAQDITDAVRYSSEELKGTARFRAMGGAFGALGGDLSAMSINPAGSAVFLNSHAAFSLSYNDKDNDTRYFNGITSTSEEEYDFDQAGAVLVFTSRDPQKDWKKFTIGFNYHRTNNFDEVFLARGTSPNSIDQYFLDFAQGVPLDLLETVEGESITDLYRFLGNNVGFGAQQAFLGFQGFIINPVSNDPDNTSYVSTIAPGSFNQRYIEATSGYSDKLTFNFATEFRNWLYLGASLNAHYAEFHRSRRLFETNSNPGSETNEVDFLNRLSTTGEGFSFQLGAIAKVNEYLRLGLAYESPTWYDFYDRTTQRLETFSAEFNDRVFVDPNVVNFFPEYELRTPGKITGSLAVLFGKRGLLSFDYSYKDFSEADFSPSADPEFAFQNRQIDNQLQGAMRFNAGGEYRIKNLSLRAGYRHEETPYNNEFTIGDLNGYSLGLGYNFSNINVGDLRIDLAYDYATRTDNPQLFQTGLTNTAEVDWDFSSVILSLSFGL